MPEFKICPVLKLTVEIHGEEDTVCAKDEKEAKLIYLERFELEEIERAIEHRMFGCEVVSMELGHAPGTEVSPA
ncbi:MAG: hypothetical protein ACLGSA_12715 [Acidobacteriota bacterium]